MHCQPGCTPADPEVVDLGASGKSGIVDGTECWFSAARRRPQGPDRLISGKTKQNAVKSMVVMDGVGHVLWSSPVRPASGGLHPRPASEGWSCSWPTGPRSKLLTYVRYQGLGAHTGGRG